MDRVVTPRVRERQAAIVKRFFRLKAAGEAEDGGLYTIRTFLFFCFLLCRTILAETGVASRSTSTDTIFPNSFATSNVLSTRVSDYISFHHGVPRQVFQPREETKLLADVMKALYMRYC